jgi:tRNA modification GTPase
VEEGLQQGVSGDFVAQDIRECMHYLGEITGEISTDEILGNIFRNFCIGK